MRSSAKTKIACFSRRKFEQGEDADSFNFLGFKFYLSRSLKGKTVPKVTTDRKRLRKKLVDLNDWCSKNRSRLKLEELWSRVTARIQGHIFSRQPCKCCNDISTVNFRTAVTVSGQVGRNIRLSPEHKNTLWLVMSLSLISTWKSFSIE